MLANLTAYEMLHILQKGKKTFSELAEILGVNVATVSAMLKSLRQLGLVRDDAEGRLAHQLCRIDICPCRIFFSRMDSSLTSFTGKSDSLKDLAVIALCF